MPSSPACTKRRSVAALLACAVLATGCATAQPKVKAVWPPPPEKARIEYLGWFRTRDQLNPGVGRRILNALLPHDANAVIVSPSGLALSPDEKRLYVACGGRGKVVVVDRDKKTMSVIGPGSRQPMAASVGVAVDAAENVYVADRMANAVIVYDRTGKFLRKVGVGVLQAPTTMAIDRAAQLLYVVSGATSNKTDHRIEVFSLTGQHLRTMGKRGEQPGEFNFPTGLAVGQDGSLFVVDTLNFRVQQFDRNGALLSFFGQIGTGGVGAFDKAKDVAFDAFGNMYVVDTAQGVQIFNPDRRPLMGFGGPPVMSIPGPIVIDSKNHIFVADFAINMVHEFQLVNTTAADSYLKPSQPEKKQPSSQPAAPGATQPSAAPAATQAGDAARP